MDNQFVLTNGIQDLDPFTGIKLHHPGIANLTSPLWIEGRTVQNDLVNFFSFPQNGSVPQNLSLFDDQMIVPNELRILPRRPDDHPIPYLLLSILTGSLLLFFQFLFKPFDIDLQPMFPRHQFGQVNWESIRIVQQKGIHSLNFTIDRFQPLEALYSFSKGPQKPFFFLFDDLSHEILLGFEFGEYVFELIREGGNKTMKQGLLPIQKSIIISHGPTENTTNHIAGP